MLVNFGSGQKHVPSVSCSSVAVVAHPLSNAVMSLYRVMKYILFPNSEFPRHNIYSKMK
jgi:hypothetical protein